MIKKIRVVAFDVWGDRRGVVPAVSEISLVQPLNEIPTCDLTVVATGVNAGLLSLPCEIAVETWDGQEWREYPNMRFLALDKDRKLEDGSTIGIKALGVGKALGWATVWEATANDTDCKRVFNAQTPGQMLTTLLSEARGRRDDTGLVWAEDMSWDFDAEHDSGDNPWPRNVRKECNRSDTLLSVIQWLSGKGAIDWRMDGRVLQVFAAGTVMEQHRDGVRLREAFSSSLPVVETWQDITTVARFAGDEGFMQEKTNPSAVRALGRVERWSEQGNVKLPETAKLYLDSLLIPGGKPGLEYRREWATGLHETQPYPFQDYNLGDWVLISPEGDNTELRVVEIQLKQAETGTVTGAEVLGTRIQSLMEKLARRTTDLSNGQVGGENGKPSGLNPATGETVTGAPQGLTVRVTQVPDSLTGGMSGAGQASWQPVADAKEYELQTLDVGAWATVATSTSTGCEFPTVGSGLVTARVRALDKENQPGPWSAEVSVNVDTGETILPYPSKPGVSSRLGIVTVEWDGKTVGADGLPAGLPTGFHRLEIAATSIPAPPKDATQVLAAAVLTRHGTMPLTGMQAGSTVYVYTRIVDITGKTGPWQTSEPASVVVRRVEASDLEANNISANTAVMGTLMAGLANILKLRVGEVHGEAAEFATALIDKLKVQTAAIDVLFTTLFKAHKIKAHHIDANYADIGTLYVGGYKIDPVALQNMGTIRNPVSYGSTGLDGTSISSNGAEMNGYGIDAGGVQINRYGNIWASNRLDSPAVTASLLGLGSQNGASITATSSFRATWDGAYFNGLLNCKQIASENNITAPNISSSSIRALKEQVEKPRDLTGILDIEPVCYRSKQQLDIWREQFGEAGPSRPLKPLPSRMVGWIAEDLEAAGLGVFCTKDEKGNLVGVQYDRISVGLWQVLRRQQEEIEKLKTRLAELGGES